MISDIMYILYGCVNMSTDKTISKELKTRLKQWKRVSKYLKKAGYVITSEDENFFTVQKDYAICRVLINDKTISIHTPFVKINDSMFPGQTTRWLYDQIWNITDIPFTYDVKSDEFHSCIYLKDATDSTVYEAVNIISEGYAEYLRTVVKLQALLNKETTSE